MACGMAGLAFIYRRAMSCKFKPTFPSWPQFLFGRIASGFSASCSRAFITSCIVMQSRLCVPHDPHRLGLVLRRRHAQTGRNTTARPLEASFKFVATMQVSPKRRLVSTTSSSVMDECHGVVQQHDVIASRVMVQQSVSSRLTATFDVSSDGFLK